MKSIKEISEIIGISKVSLYKLIKKPELKEHIKKEYNTTFVDEVGEQIIKEYYARLRLTSLSDILEENLKEIEDVNPDLKNKNEVNNSNIVKILESQLKEKDQQIKIKDEQILRKDEQLNAILVLLNKEKEIKLINDSYTPDEQIGTAEKSKPKKNFFNWFFKK